MPGCILWPRSFDKIGEGGRGRERLVSVFRSRSLLLFRDQSNIPDFFSLVSIE